MAVFSRITTIDLPAGLVCEASGRTPAFEIAFTTDGEVPFPQVIVRGQGREHLVNGAAVRPAPAADAAAIDWIADGPAGLFGPGEVEVQVEGCRKADITTAGGGDWIKAFARLRVEPAPRPVRPVASAGPDASRVRLYFGIHKHMHQPYYNTTDWTYWDGEKDGIFGSRGAAIPTSCPPRCASTSAAASPRRAFYQLERLADRAARPLCPRRAVRRPLCRLERRAARHRRREDRSRLPARCLYRLRLLPSADGADPRAQHRPPDRLAPADHPRGRSASSPSRCCSRRRRRSTCG
ncbi:MAG: hypothetical protein U1E38_04840 [Rhodospirillales bacterium]